MDAYTPSWRWTRVPSPEDAPWKVKLKEIMSKLWPFNKQKKSRSSWREGRTSYVRGYQTPPPPRGSRHSGQIDWSWWISRLAVLMFAGVISGIVMVLVAFVVFSRDLPNPDKVVRRDGFATKILDRNGNSLYDVYAEEKRIPVEWEEIPESLKLATIAIEDKEFYKHQGFDLRGIARGFSRLFTRGRAQGGSTLTQQLVKNVLLSSERSVIRKIKEFVLAVQLERKFTKDEILRMYLNEAPYGGTAWGVGAGAELYFNKPVSELNMLESAIIAGLPQSPTAYSPFGKNPEAFKDRTKHVLRRMYEDGYLSNDEYQSALQELETVTFANGESEFEAPHFVIYVKDVLTERYGEDMVERGGLTVTTSLDLELQNQAQQIVAEEIAKVVDQNISNGAAMVMNPQTGEILAMVGSRGYNDPDVDGKVNVPLTLQQPGSTIKPVTYVTGLRKGYTAATMIMDVATEFPGGAGQPPYKPVNYDGKYRGPVSVREALGNSLNVPAVKMLAMVGVRDTLKMGFDMGLSTLEPTKENLSRLGLSMTLGGGDVTMIELISAYSAFANGGHKVVPVSVLKVEDPSGNVIEEFNPTEREQVLTAEEAWLISNILSDNNARSQTFGLNSAINISGRPVAVKTGTTNDRRDNWTIGWSPSRIVSVWVGNNDNSEMGRLVSGVTGAAPIWRKITLTAHENVPVEQFKKPEGIMEMEVDAVSGYSGHHDFPTKTEYFIKGTEPIAEDPIHRKIAICKSEGKLATPVDIASGNSEEREYFVFKEQDPFEAASGTNKWQEGILNWIYANHKDDSKYNPPTEYCGQGNQLIVQLTDPGHQSQFDNNKVTIKANPVGTNPISKVEFYADDKLLSSFSNKPYEDTVTLDTGPHEIKVIATDDKGNKAESSVKIGVKVPWDWAPSPTPTSVILPSITPAQEAGPSATPTP